MSASDTEPGDVGRPPEIRAGRLLRIRAIWITPVVVASVLIFLMTLVYVGSIIDPSAHLSGLPVLVADQDAGGQVGPDHLDVGQEVVSALRHSPAVSSRLSLTPGTLAQAKGRMDHDDGYVTMVVPRDFTMSLLELYGLAGPDTGRPSVPAVQLLANVRAGNVGVTLATDVLEPALRAVGERVGHQLSTLAASGHVRPASGTLSSQPISVATVTYRPLPARTALGLSAFYISLLSIMCGFLGAVLVNSTVDAALGYTTTEIGPRWRQRAPVAITRWQTLLAKWAMSLVVVPVLSAVMLLVAVAILGMYAPHVWLLWLFTAFAGVTIAAGTLVLFAAFGTLGQLVAMLLFVYLALASSGGTVPLEALPSFFRFVANFEPLRQVLDGVRAILYFDASGDAGLTRGLVTTTIGLALWVVLGAAVTNWYDRRGLYRLRPELLEYVRRSAEAYTDRRRPPAGAAATRHPGDGGTTEAKAPVGDG